jgi:hypothetical protein
MYDYALTGTVTPTNFARCDPRDWVGIAPNRDVITGNVAGNAVNNGPWLISVRRIHLDIRLVWGICELTGTVR